MFFKKREVNPYPISDKAIFRNVDKTLTLFVRANPFTLVSNLRKANELCGKLTDESPDGEKLVAARALAAAIFGYAQADQLVEFYEDPLTVINACGQYFDILKPKIEKAQKK